LKVRNTNKALSMAEKMDGLEEIELIVASHNENVVKLYEKVGFTKTFFESHALKIGVDYIDAYHMKREIKKLTIASI
jgi:ribosomal protein S18 acetylase RimI-like enzyme